MNVLEKILEEIEKKKQALEYNSLFEVGQASINEIRNRVSGLKYAEEIIRSHMGGATDTDDTEEKIREHIAECLHRIDNIRSFIGSKKYSDDARCRKNIVVLKKSIVAMEEYLRFKKRNDNDGWIPVEDGLPEEHKSMFAKLKGTHMWNNAMFEKVSDEVNVTIELEDGIRKTTTSHTLDGKWKVEKECVVNKKVIAWRPLPEPYKPKKDLPAAGNEHIMNKFMKVE